ncbi:Type 1 glutamine amidotransferase-like domain-containing protein [Gordonia sp. VNK21]|uniref:Type 1 glutamine amidotransferase-like domain-containing protein n=1 Tax=Gordonia sp. VNK21 TaxID=3382483 RepID=UPI0038D3E90E
MNLLLLSWGAGAVPGFLAAHTRPGAGPVAVVMIDDAARVLGEPNFSQYERERLEGFGCAVTAITAGTLGSADEFARALDGADAVYVCGGETFVLLEALARHDMREVLADRVRAGLPYLGLSAGAVIAGPSAEPVTLLDDPGLAPGLTDHRELGLIDAVPVPHADGRIPGYPPPVFDRIRAEYAGRYTLAFIDDDQALLVSGAAAQLVASPDDPRRPTRGDLPADDARLEP